MNLIGAMPELNNRGGCGLSAAYVKLICRGDSTLATPRNRLVKAGVVPSHLYKIQLLEAAGNPPLQIAD